MRPACPSPSGLASLLLAAVLVTVPLAPTSQADHEIPQVLDEVDIEGHGGYAAWRIQVDPPEGDWGRLHLDLGHHARANATNTAYTYVGVWFVNLDHDYVWQSLAATNEMDGVYAHTELQDPVPLEASLATPQKAWSARNGGELSLPSGQWLVLAFLVSDGTLEAPTTLGTDTVDGVPEIELVNATAGDQYDVFAFENGEFGGAVNTYLAADAEDSCPFCGNGADARVIRDGRAQTQIENHLFGAFSSPGSVASEAAWTSSTNGGTGSSFYWFHGAAPGIYQFHVHENVDAYPDREPVAAFGADVRIPGP